MAMMEFNLVDEPWIPCVAIEGEKIECGIRETLNRAHELREVFDPSPLVTTALHRLLLAVLYRALGGIKDFKAWKEIFEKGRFDADRINRYLDKWMDRFYLFHPRYPFYQMAGLETNKNVTVARLATELASGNNPTLFDHTFETKRIAFSYREAARNLVACQAFAISGGIASSAQIGGVKNKRPNFSDSTATRGMNIWLQGKTLFHTLVVNTSFFGDKSLPPWEMDDPHINRDKSEPDGVVDILTWQSRLIRLIADEEKVERMFFTQGRPSNKEDRKDPMKVYIKKTVKKKEELGPHGLTEGKAAWRDSHTIIMARNPNSDEKRPECFNLVSQAIEKQVISENESFITHVSGLATKGKAAKIILWRHERLPLPIVLLKPDFQEVLGLMIERAEKAAGRLRGRMRRILTAYLESENKPTNGEEQNELKKEPVNQGELEQLLRSLDPLPQYWARLEPGFYELLRALPQDWDYLHGGWKEEKDLRAGREWGERIKKETRRALEESVRMLGNSARAIRAIERVGTVFTDKDLGIE